jgi:ubiquinone/menaquinone biosynthesis C-methylase UbiE
MAVSSAEFWDRIAPRYSRQPIADTERYARKLAATQARMRPDMTVLEFGCGTGSTALVHAPHVARIDATDLSAAMIAIGRDKARAAGVTNVDFQQAGVEDFDAPDGTYDMVLALNLLHLVPDRAAALAKIHRLLTPGGIFVSSTVCLADRLWFLRPLIPVMQWVGKAPFVSFARSAEVRREIETAGFVLREHWCHGRATSLFVIAEKTAV